MLFPSWTHCHGHKGKESSNFQADVKQAHTIITFEIELLITVSYTWIIKDCAYFFFNTVGDSKDIYLMKIWLEGDKVGIESIDKVIW